MRDIGKNIRTLRVERDMSQDQLAEALHVTRQTVSNYETGRSRPDVEMLTALAEALGADVKEVLYGPERQAGWPRLRRRFWVGLAVICLLGLAYLAMAAGLHALEMDVTWSALPFLLLYRMLGLPVLLAAAGWTAAAALLALLRSRPLDRSWAPWTRRAILAVMAVWLLAMVPFFLIEAQAAVESLHARLTGALVSLNESFPLNPIAAWTLRRGSRFIPGLAAVLGFALGLLGFPVSRRRKQPEGKNAEQSNSPE